MVRNLVAYAAYRMLDSVDSLALEDGQHDIWDRQVAFALTFRHKSG